MWNWVYLQLCPNCCTYLQFFNFSNTQIIAVTTHFFSVFEILKNNIFHIFQSIIYITPYFLILCIYPSAGSILERTHYSNAGSYFSRGGGLVVKNASMCFTGQTFFDLDLGKVDFSWQHTTWQIFAPGS